MLSQQSLAATGLAFLMATAANALPFNLVVRDPPKALPQRATANDLKYERNDKRSGVNQADVIE
jgi:hypothetical protein